VFHRTPHNLGSTSLTLDSAGGRLNPNTELRCYPYGVARYTAGTTPTAFNFTGQRKDSGSGLLFYNARWYDPSRDVQPSDTRCVMQDDTT
jgi:hypothetical protein